MEYVANAFFVAPGRCYRMVPGAGGKHGQPSHCGEPVAWRGRFVTPLGQVHRVWSCARHCGNLVGLRQVTPEAADTQQGDAM
jgi:hypothetical protein